LKKLFTLSLILIFALMFLSCGGDKNDSSSETAEAVEQPREETEAARELDTKPEQEEAKMFARNPNVDPAIFEPPDINTSPEIYPEELEEGTPESAGYWFAEYFTSGDSTMAYTLCTDSMVEVVRQILQQPRQISLMKANRDAGYTLLSASKALDSCDAGECSVCLMANFMDETRQECNFRFRNINGEWKLCRFGK
jgi:hypothetical protein